MNWLTNSFKRSYVEKELVAPGSCVCLPAIPDRRMGLTHDCVVSTRAKVRDSKKKEELSLRMEAALLFVLFFSFAQKCLSPLEAEDEDDGDDDDRRRQFVTCPSMMMMMRLARKLAEKWAKFARPSEDVRPRPPPASSSAAFVRGKSRNAIRAACCSWNFRREREKAKGLPPGCQFRQSGPTLGPFSEKRDTF